MYILTLPNELLLQIAQNLTSTSDLNSFVQTNHRLSSVLITALYRRISQGRGKESSTYGAVEADHRTWIIALSYAVSYKNEYMLRTILNDIPPASSVSIKSGLHITLHRAPSKCDDEITKQIFERGPGISIRVKLGFRKFRERQALSWAARFGEKKAVQLLLAHGAEVNARDPIGETALHQAAETGHKEIVEILLAKGADHTISAHPELKWKGPTTEKMTFVKSLFKWDQHERAPLYKAALAGELEIFKFLLQLGGPTIETEWYLMYWEGVEEMCPGLYKLILPQISAIPDKPYLTNPLSIAVEKGDEELVKAILENGGSACTWINEFGVNIFGPQRTTILHKAAERGEVAIVNLLLDYGADINAINSKGRTALHYATPKIVRTLLDRGTDIGICGLEDTCSTCQYIYETHRPIPPTNSTDPTHTTNSINTLLTTVKYGNYEAFKSALETGGGFRAVVGQKKGIALYIAVKRSETCTVKLLLNYGADTNACDGWVVTPPWIANEPGDIDIKSILEVENGVDVVIEHMGEKYSVSLQITVAHDEPVEPMLVQRRCCFFMR